MAELKAISQKMARLIWKKCGSDVVTTRREGKQIYYSIASGAAMAVMQVLYSQYCGASKQSTEGETA